MAKVVAEQGKALVSYCQVRGRWSAVVLGTGRPRLVDLPGDDTTIELTLRTRHVPVLEAIAEQPIVPEHVWSKVADPLAFTNEEPVATGPFTRVASFKNPVY